MQVELNNNLNRNGNSSITVIIVMAIALLFAMILGVQLGSGDYAAASGWLVAGLILIYLVHLHHYTWQIALLFVFLGFNFKPFGFSFHSLHIGLALGGALALLYIMSPISFRPVNYLEGTGVGMMKFFLILWVGYGAIHMAWTHIDPPNPSQYAFKNALKSYVESFGGPAIVLWFMIKPSGFQVGKNWARTLITLLFIGVTVNLLIRFYFLAQGYGIERAGATAVTTAERVDTPLYVPVINMSPNPVILRTLCPLALAISLMFITAPGFMRSQKRSVKLMLILIVFMSLAGAVLSAGRGAVLIAGFFALVIAVARGKMISILAVGVVGIFFLAAVNFMSTTINERAPYFVQRSLQYFMLEKGEAVYNIESSTRWRSELARRAYAEWRSDPRLFLFGRATYSFTDADIVVHEQLGHYEAMMEISLRRGNAHRLTADCLIQYGIVGLVLFYMMFLSILRFLFLLYRRQKSGETEYRNLTFILLISFLISLPMTFVATGWISIYNVWLLLLLILGYTQEAAKARWEDSLQEAGSPIGLPVRATS